MKVDHISLATKYTFFAALATAANILTQEFAIQIHDGSHSLAYSILLGTAVGLVVKFELDKRFIFGVKAVSFGHNTRLLTLYSMTGIVTTMVFWGMELAFDLIWGTRPMRYLGAALGLTIGYIIKYQLDKRHVFQRN